MTFTTINDLPRVVQYTASGSQVQFDYPFPIYKPQDLVVYVNQQLMVYETPVLISPNSYTVFGAGLDGGGFVSFNVLPSNGATVTIISDLVIDRISQYGQNAKWRADITNNDLNKLTLIAQEQEDALNRTLRLPEYEALGILPLPSAAARALKTLTFDANGNPTLVNAATVTTAPNLSSSRDQFTATAGQVVFQVAGGYTPGFIDVFVNGAKLFNGTDFTAVDGVTVTLIISAIAGDKVDIVAYGTGASTVTNATQVQYSYNGAITRTLAAKLGELPTVDDFGAAGDGITDDSVAVRAAMSAHAVGGPPVTFREGKTYLLSSWTVFDTTSPITIYADGATIIGPAVGTTKFMSVGNVFNIFGGKWIGWFSVQARTAGQAGSIPSFQLISIEFDSCAVPINLGMTCDNFLIDDLTFTNPSASTGIVIGTVTYADQDTYITGRIESNSAYSLQPNEVVPSNYTFLPGNIGRYGAISGTDCTEAIQDAITSLLANRGGLVYMPAGIWMFSAPLVVNTSNKGITFKGEGASEAGQTSAATVLQWIGGASICIDIGTDNRNVNFEDFDFENTGSCTSFVRVGWTDMTRFHNINIRPTIFPTTAAIILGVGANRCENTQFDNVTIRGTAVNQVGIAANRAQDLRAHRLNLVNCRMSIGINGSMDIINAAFSGCTFNSMPADTQPCVDVWQCQSLAFHACHFEPQSTNYAVDVHSVGTDKRGILFSGCYFSGTNACVHLVDMNFANADLTMIACTTVQFANPYYLVRNQSAASITLIGNSMAGTGATLTTSMANTVAMGNVINNVVVVPDLYLHGSATYDPGSLADAAGATTTVTVTGAVLGDFVVASFSLDLQGISLTAYVSAADTVSVRFQNESGGVLDLASGTLRATVIRK